MCTWPKGGYFLLNDYLNKNKFPIKEYFSKGLLVSRARKNVLFKTFLIEHNVANELKYKQYRNCFNRCLKTAKRLFYEEKIDKSNCSKTAWKYLYDVLGKTKGKKSKIDEINIENTVSSDPEQIANSFNSFFASVAQTTIAKIPSTKCKHSDFPSKEVTSQFAFKPVDSGVVSQVLRKLEPKISCDINGFSPKLLKESSDMILKPLTHLINLSLTQGTFPCELNISRTCPIFKNGCRKDVSNYHPISCLLVLSKVFEKVVFNQLYDYLLLNNILTPNQFGFQPGKSSTIHPIIHILNYIAEAFNQNKLVVACFLDLSKAFDLINHRILLEKLKKISLNDISIKWFSSYLSNRKMFSCVNGTLSSSFKILERSVPQGSILGPLLFLIFVNDMPLSNNLDSYLFADNTTALTSGDNIHEIGTFVNSELHKLGLWLRSNELCINTSKTKIMVFSKNKNIGEFPLVFNYNDIDYHDGESFQPLERITSNSPTPAIKMLGVYLDETLNPLTTIARK